MFGNFLLSTDSKIYIFFCELRIVIPSMFDSERKAHTKTQFSVFVQILWSQSVLGNRMKYLFWVSEFSGKGLLGILYLFQWHIFQVCTTVI